MTEEQRVKVWDIAVRIFHWSLVVLFFAAYLSGEDGGLFHVYAGYGVLALVAFRIVWGIIGTRHARFSDFVYGRAATLQYARSLLSARPVHYLGHNPLGGWMVVALLVCLIGACWSGIEAYGEQGYGPLALQDVQTVSTAAAGDNPNDYGREGKTESGKVEGDKFWKEIHEALSSLTLFIVILHIIGVLVASVLHRENLVKAMITGYKIPRAP